MMRRSLKSLASSGAQVTGKKAFDVVTHWTT
jgi:hypothetical protein